MWQCFCSNFINSILNMIFLSVLFIYFTPSLLHYMIYLNQLQLNNVLICLIMYILVRAKQTYFSLHYNASFFYDVLTLRFENNHGYTPIIQERRKSCFVWGILSPSASASAVALGTHSLQLLVLYCDPFM